MKEKFPLCEALVVWRRELEESRVPGASFGAHSRGNGRQGASHARSGGLTADVHTLTSVPGGLRSTRSPQGWPSGLRADAVQSGQVTSSRVHSLGAEGQGTDHGSLCSEPSPAARAGAHGGRREGERGPRGQAWGGAGRTESLT